VDPGDGQGPLLPGASETPRTQWLLDDEVHQLVDEAHTEVAQLLSEQRDELDNLAHALLKAVAASSAELQAAGTEA
jgi:ATP-dependent Zn protease